MVKLKTLTLDICSFTPDGKFVSTRLSKMKAATSRERIDKSEDRTARFLNLRECCLQLIAIENDQSRTFFRGAGEVRLEEAAIQPLILKRGVFGSIVCERPAKSGFKERFCCPQIFGWEFNVIHFFMLIHVFSLWSTVDADRALNFIERDHLVEGELPHRDPERLQPPLG